MTKDPKVESAHSPSFTNFIIYNKRNRTFLFAVFLISVIIFIIFKLFYPYADYFSDSYSYLTGAYFNLPINIWPIGYSKYLIITHAISSSDTFLIATQYFLLEISCLLLFFTILYFYPLSRTNTLILFVFFFVNPLFLYVSNYVNSDPLFAALSVFWITHLLWIIHAPRPNQIFLQAILLFLCFTVRNNAYYYPLLTLFALFISHRKLLNKLLGVILCAALITPFIIYEREAAYKLTGKKQFSLFTGWQLANNALYMRGNIEVSPEIFPSDKSKRLDSISNSFFTHVPNDFNSMLAAYVANYFIREPHAPLKTYFRTYYAPKHSYDLIKTWGEASITFEEYGSTLIKKYPFSYFRYFALINAKNYILPPLEKLEVYNLGSSTVDPLAQYWFDYKSEKVSYTSNTVQSLILFIFPILFFSINLYFLTLVLWALFQKIRFPKEMVHSIALIVGFWILNFGFTITTAMNVLRYQVFPFIVLLTFSLVLSELIAVRTGELKKTKLLQPN
mgnify:CR=1 FL=1